MTTDETDKLKAIVTLANRVARGFNEGALDTCILTSYALAGTLTDLGYDDARPVRVEAASFPEDHKLRGRILGFSGRPGVSRDRAEDGCWSGHLAVCIGQSCLLDPTLDQSNNDQWADAGVAVEPVAVPLTPEFWDLDLPNRRVVWARSPTVATRYMLLPQRGFARAPDAPFALASASEGNHRGNTCRSKQPGPSMKLSGSAGRGIDAAALGEEISSDRQTERGK
jgi:hypothetical protein